MIVNVDMRPALFRVRSSMRPGEAIYVVNSRGDYLVHPDPAREFASLLDKPGNWQDDFPYLAASIGARQGVARIVKDQAGRPGGVALAPAMLADREWVGIIETFPNAVFVAPAASIRNTSMLVGLIAVLGAAALAVFVANSLTRPIRQLTSAVEGIGKNDPPPIPVDASGETGVLARAFARVLDEANAKTEALQREVQEHRRTEAARDHHAARERHFSAAVESSNDAIITKSLDGKITGWNPAAERLFGYTAAEAVGKDIEFIVPPDRTAEVHDILRRVSWGETIEQYETERVRKDGRSGRGLAQHISDQVAGGRHHRRIEDRPRHYRKQANPARTPPADRGAPPHFRNFAGSDPGDRSEGSPGSGEPQRRNYPGIYAGRNDRSQRERIPPP